MFVSTTFLFMTFFVEDMNLIIKIWIPILLKWMKIQIQIDFDENYIFKNKILFFLELMSIH